MSTRWEHLLERKPIPLVDHLIDEVAKLLAKDLATWPLPVTDFDLDTGRSFAALLAPDARRPEDAVFDEAFRVARWELDRDLDASADYFRNRRWMERGLDEPSRTPILFISRWLVEQLLSLRECTQSKITRPQLIECLERTRSRLVASRGLDLPP